MTELSTALSEKYSPESIKRQLENGNKVDLSVLSKEVRLQVINDFLKSENLRPLEGIGNGNRGEMEFVGINAYKPDRFVARVDFETSLGENCFQHLNFISANTAQTAGAIIVPIIKSGEDTYIVLNRQFRPVIGKVTTEITRGFPDQNDKFASKPIQVAMRELKEETGIEASVENSQFIDLGEAYENTGTHNVKNSLTAMIMNLSADSLEKLKHRVVTEDSGHKITTLLVSPIEAFKLVEDNHSAAILAKLIAANPDLLK